MSTSYNIFEYIWIKDTPVTNSSQETWVYPRALPQRTHEEFHVALLANGMGSLPLILDILIFYLDSSPRVRPMRPGCPPIPNLTQAAPKLLLIIQEHHDLATTLSRPYFGLRRSGMGQVSGC